MEARLPSAWRRSPAAVSHAYEMRQRGAPRTEVMHPFGNLSHPGSEERESASTPGLFLAGKTPVLGRRLFIMRSVLPDLPSLPGGLKKFPYRGEEKLFWEAGKSGKLGHRGAGERDRCAGCAGCARGNLCRVCRCARCFLQISVQVCRCARCFSKTFLSGDVHTKTFSNRSAPCTDLRKVFQITLHRCTELM